MSQKENNAVKLRHYLEIVYNGFVHERCFQAESKLEESWWLTSNRMASLAVNDKFDSW